MNQPVQDLLGAYEASSRKLRDAIAAIPAKHHTRVPGDPAAGRWTLRQLVGHLADADAVFDHRMRRVIAEDRPAMAEWSEERFVDALAYNEQDVAPGLDLLDLNRRRTLPLLQSLSTEAWQRVGIHERRGPQTLADILQFAGGHVTHHLAFVERKAAAF